MNYMLSFQADIDDGIWPVMVPKFLLQPVIENSILHGFRNQRDNWNIHMKACFDGDRILIRVADTGSGLMETEVQNINRRLNDFNFDSTTNNKGYALRKLSSGCLLYTSSIQCQKMISPAAQNLDIIKPYPL